MIKKNGFRLSSNTIGHLKALVVAVIIIGSFCIAGTLEHADLVATQIKGE